MQQVGRRVGLGLRRLDDGRKRPQIVQDIPQVRPEEDVWQADSLMPEPQDPIDLPAGNPDAEAATLIRDDRSDLLAAVEERQEPTPLPAIRVVAEQIQVGVLDVHRGVGYGVLHTAHRILLDDLPANTAEPQQLRVDVPAMFFTDLNNCLLHQVLGLEAGHTGKPLGLQGSQRQTVGRSFTRHHSSSTSGS